MTLTLDQIIQILLAIGTFLAVIIAIFGERIQFWLRLGPKLKLELIDPVGESISGPSPDILFRYYHLRVSNQHKWSPATNTRIVITGLARPASDGRFSPQSLSGPLQFLWRFNKFHPSIYSTVGYPEICDLGYLQRGSKFTLSLFVIPTNLNVTISANERMRVEVRAIADNAESEPLYVEISWDGKWSEDTPEMAKHR
jgi:hypothetical protein